MNEIECPNCRIFFDICHDSLEHFDNEIIRLTDIIEYAIKVERSVITQAYLNTLTLLMAKHTIIKSMIEKENK